MSPVVRRLSGDVHTKDFHDLCSRSTHLLKHNDRMPGMFLILQKTSKQSDNPSGVTFPRISTGRHSTSVAKSSSALSSDEEHTQDSTNPVHGEIPYVSVYKLEVFRKC